MVEAFRQAPSNAERGAKFEQLMVRYFELDPMLSARYDRVWRWIDWPDHQGGDTGIDLVARERDTGELTAVQCKFYEPTHTLAKRDIDSFLTAWCQVVDAPPASSSLDKESVEDFGRFLPVECLSWTVVEFVGD
ncbi:MAG: restriction endonuclease, partial [Pseudonocardiales bacterium]